MYHGILQHRVFLTSYLRKQAEDRGLDKVIRHGRIWRVAHSAKPLSPKPQLAKASGPELVTALTRGIGLLEQAEFNARRDAERLGGELRQKAKAEADTRARKASISWPSRGPVGTSVLTPRS